MNLYSWLIRKFWVLKIVGSSPTFILILDFQIDSNLTLISSYSLKEFDKDFSVDDTLYFTDEEEY